MSIIFFESRKNVGFQIGDNHTFSDWGLKCTSFSITPPEPQRSLLQIPGKNGVIDASLPEVSNSYQQRQIEMIFDAPDNNFEEWALLYSEITNAIHGKYLDIVPDFDSDWKYSGWITVLSIKEDKVHSDFTITVNCDPFKHKISATKVSKTISSEVTFTVINSRESVEPKLVTNGNITLQIGNALYNYQSGTYAKAGFKLGQGETSIKLTGNATVSIEYTEGSF